MTKRRFTCSRVLALLLPVILGFACSIERDWSKCTPRDPCLKGFTCTDDYRCIPLGDAGTDALLSVDSQIQTDAGGGGWDSAVSGKTDGPSSLTTAPDAAGKPEDALPDAASSTTPGLDGPTGAGGSGGGTDAAADVPTAPTDAPSLLDSGVPCSVGSDCASGYCDTATNTCATKLPNGAPASLGSQCASGVVADGVCCNQACTGCSACTSDLNGQALSTTGQCLPVLSGKVAPRGACMASPPCGPDGTCDGRGGCYYPAAGASCGDPSCAGSTLTTKACDSTHTCASTSQACPNSAACADSASCSAKKLQGAACSTGTECASGSCVDNLAGTSKICCSSACSTCQGCKIDSSGCSTKNAGAADTACGTAASCQTGTCNSAGACQQATAGTSCGTNLYCTGAGQCTCQAGGSCQPIAPCMQGTYSCSTGTQVCTPTVAWGTDHACGLPQSCSGTTKKLAQTCDGSGLCSAQTTHTCLYRCNAQGTDCDDTNYCSPNPCSNGGTCTNTTSTYACSCTGGWGGPTCATKLFEGLGTLPPEYGESSYANGVSADGTIVVGEVDGAAEEVSSAFKWTSGIGMTTLALSSTVPDTNATGISAGGIVGRGKFLSSALFWTGSLEYDLNDYSGNGSVALGVSNNGTIVGFANTSDAAKAVRWTVWNSAPVALDTAGTYADSSAAGISSDGSTIVGTTSSGAFRWTSSLGMVLLSGGTNTTANAASADGGVIVGSLNPLSGPPVFWNGASRTALGTAVGEAFAVNGDGSVIVGTAGGVAFIWDSSNGRRSLATALTGAGADLSGWNLSRATGVSFNGKVFVGWGSHNGAPEAWIARLP